MSKEKLAEIRRNLDAQDEKIVQLYPLPDYRCLSIYFNSQLIRLGRRMHVRQQALATAQLYVRRFYTKVPIRDTNPYLILATCLYLALKTEECPQHIRIIVSEAHKCWQEVMPTYTEKLAECEFYVISELNSYLIAHHPYRTLQELTPVLGLTTEDNNTSWQVINDSYLTDLPLIYPPHIIALTAIFVSVVLKPTTPQANLHSGASPATNTPSSPPTLPASSNGGHGTNTNTSASTGGNMTTSGQGSQNRIAKLIDWYAESKTDMEAIIDCTQEIMSLYELWDTFTIDAEKQCKEKLSRMIKQRGIS